MFNIHESLPTCHDLGEKHRTTDVLFGKKVTFSSLLLKEEIQQGLTRCGYIYLSPIQKNALPLALTGTSIIAHAKSGTGKTLVYCLSALNNVLEKKQRSLQCLILSPTREIAKQIYDVFKNVGFYIKDLRVEYFIGGTPLDLDVLKCKDCQIAIGAPGRIKHLIDMGELKVDHVKMLVLDEVDALLCNKEFAIRELASQLPAGKQTVVCTATFSDHIKQLLNPISSTIKYVTVNESMNSEKTDQITSNILIGIKQFVAPVFSDSTSLDAIRKRNKLIDILRNFKYDQCFVFVNYVTIAKGLCNMLVSNNFPALWVSSEQNQSTRISTLNKLKLNQCNILVTTDLAARGIDVHNVNLVINMGIPSPPDVYIHRMGRAGRYGSEGAVITILHEGYEMEQFYKVVSSVSTDPVDLFVLPDAVPKTINESELQKVHCKPDSNALPNVNEFQFKKNNENQTKSTTKKKSKKSKKKKQSKKEESSPQVLESNSAFVEKEEDSAEEFIPDNVAVDKEMETIVEHYIEAIKEEVDRGSVSVDETNLRNLFKPSRNNVYVVQYSNFYKPTFIQIPEGDEDEDDDVFIQTIDDTCVIEYMRYIKNKHAFLDEQKIPCSMTQFLELVKCNDSLIRRFVSVDVQDSVKDILEKIRNMLTENKRKQSVSVKSMRSETSNFVNIPNDPSRRINQQMKFYRAESLDTMNSIEHETSNWMVSRTDYLSRQYSPKRGSREHSTLPIPNFTDDPPDLHSDAPYTVFRSSRNDIEDVQQTDYDDESYQQSTTPLNTTRVNNSNEIPNPHLHPEYVTCPNCRHEFRLSRSENLPFLPSMKSHVDVGMERRIWQHHFNFISSQMSSRSFMFGNRNS